jgi:3-demethoxyubiquinol 3-hydroxylase
LYVFHQTALSLAKKSGKNAALFGFPLQTCNKLFYLPQSRKKASALDSGIQPLTPVPVEFPVPTMQTPTDRFFAAADTALRTLFVTPHTAAPCPTVPGDATALSDDDTRRSAGLMRVNHVGEVCAQALYTAQGLTTPNPTLRAHFQAACREETDHLAWTAQRLDELGARPSLLNPLWYAGAFGLGLLAGRMGDALSLGFVVETERQVGEHLQSHLSLLPGGDHASRAIVAQMHDDELRHADAAQASGAAELPEPVKQLMRTAAKLMTSVAERI